MGDIRLLHVTTKGQRLLNAEDPDNLRDVVRRGRGRPQLRCPTKQVSRKIYVRRSAAEATESWPAADKPRYAIRQQPRRSAYAK